MTEAIHVRGEGGAVWKMNLPLRPDHEKRLASGHLVRVNADGSPYEDAEPLADEQPSTGEDDGEAGGTDEGDEEQPAELAAFLAEPMPDPPAAAPTKRVAKKATPSA